VSPVQLVLTDVDGVITRGEGQAAELAVLERLADLNRQAANDPLVPAITLCTGRQAPYVELMAQMTGVYQPCIFEHGAGVFFPRDFLFEFDPLLGPDYAARLARLRSALHDSVLAPRRGFVQPGKEATMTLYPLGSTSLDELYELACKAAGEEFAVARNVQGIEVRPHGIDKGLGLRRIAALVDLPLSAVAGIGDSDPDLSFLRACGFSAAPSNATPCVRAAVDYVASAAFGDGLLEILDLILERNRDSRLTDR
jgi:hydroxymethylpyrimidine pyrophosphatase-like HAD family hydrolase